MFFREVIAHKTIIRNKAVFPGCLSFDCSNTLKAGFSYCSALQQMVLFASAEQVARDVTWQNLPLRRMQGLIYRKSRNFSVAIRVFFFISSKQRCLQARNFAVILIFIPFTTYQRTSFTEWAGRKFRNGFSSPKRFRDFRQTGPRCRKI